MNQNTTAQYKPKTGIINRDEIIGDNEMFFLTVLTDEFEPRVMPSQELLMRRGCLAEDGDIVAPGNQPDEKRPVIVPAFLCLKSGKYCQQETDNF